MGRVTGIGGLFFRAKDPATLLAWCACWFGIPAGGLPWRQVAGMTVFALFAASTDYFLADQQSMLNLRVEGLPEMIAAFQVAGVAVETQAAWDGDGTSGPFARVHDPEGNPIKLWEPPAA